MIGMFPHGCWVYLLPRRRKIFKNEDVMSSVVAKKGSTAVEPRTGNPGSSKRAAAGLAALGAGLWAWPAEAHVKWFAPYIVNAAPQPISATLTNVWFWTG